MPPTAGKRCRLNRLRPSGTCRPIRCRSGPVRIRRNRRLKYWKAPQPDEPAGAGTATSFFINLKKCTMENRFLEMDTLLQHPPVNGPAADNDPHGAKAFS